MPPADSVSGDSDQPQFVFLSGSIADEERLLRDVTREPRLLAEQRLQQGRAEMAEIRRLAKRLEQLEQRIAPQPVRRPRRSDDGEFQKYLEALRADRRLRVVRLTMSLTEDHRVINPNSMMLHALGYTADELDGAPAAILRTGENIHKTGAAQFAQLDRLRNGESDIETFDGYLISKSGNRITTHVVATWDPTVEPRRWPLVIEISEADLPGGPQFKSLVDQLPWMQWRQAQYADNLRDLKVQVDDRFAEVQQRISNSADALMRETRAEMWDVVQQHELERTVDATSQVRKPRKARSDKGVSKVYPDDAMFVDKLKGAIGHKTGEWPTIEALAQELTLSPNAFKSRLHNNKEPRLILPGETSQLALRRLTREWYPETFLAE
jgi:hypothetical protein